MPIFHPPIGFCHYFTLPKFSLYILAIVLIIFTIDLLHIIATEVKSISDWCEKNKKAGEIWRNMTLEEKNKHYQTASQSPTTSSLDQYNKHHETEWVVD